MKLPLLLSSTVLIATSILGINNFAYSQCRGGYCPIPNAYNDQNAPSKYGYDTNSKANPNWQGNQNPNWQGNQNPYYRNDNGWRDNDNNNQPYYQSGDNVYYPHNTSSNSDPNISSQNAFYNSGNPQSYYYNNTNNSPTSGQYSYSEDKLLQHTIDNTLKNNFLHTNYDSVHARVYNGNVTLSGSVESENERQNVEKRVRNIPGVRDVNDQLHVGISSQASFNSTNYINYGSQPSETLVADNASSPLDEELQKKVEDTLKSNYLKKNYDTVVATVSNGVVTLSGTVDSEKDRQDIHDRIQKINGIKNIVDRLQVSGEKANNTKSSLFSR